ncbi:hypothetical protein ES702_00367 [subsurface metagenome]
MSTISSPLVADWIAKELRWKYIVRDITKSLLIPAGNEKKIGDYSKTEGVFLFGLFVFDRPFGGVRIDAQPEWPVTLDIPTLWANGVVAPNVWGWVSRYRPAPYVGNVGTYALLIPQGQVWQSFFKLFIVNANPNVAINCTRHLYMMAVLEQPRSAEARERFEAEGEN